MQQKTIDKDEIDLNAFFLSVNLYIKNHKKALAFFVLGGMLAGTTLYYLLPTSYKSSCIFHSEVVETNTLNTVVEGLQIPIKDKNTQLVSKLLNLPPAICAGLVKVKAVVPDYEAKVIGVLDKPHTLEITPYFLNDSPAYRDSLLKGFLYYLNNNEYVKKQQQLLQEQHKQMIKRYNSDIIFLESMGARNANEFLITRNQGLIISDPSSIFKMKNELNEKKELVINQLANDEIQVVRPFLDVEVASFNLLMWLLLGGVIGAVFTLIFTSLLPKRS